MCAAAMLLALLAPTAAFANHEGVPPGAEAPPVEQGAPPPPVETQEAAEDTDTLAVVGTLGGLLALAGGLIVVRERRRPARET